METIYMPDGEFVPFVRRLHGEGKAEMVAIDGRARWVCEIDGVKKIVRPSSAQEHAENIA